MKRTYVARDVVSALCDIPHSTKGDLERPVAMPCPISRMVEGAVSFVRRPRALDAAQLTSLPSSTLLWPVSDQDLAPEGDFTIIFVDNPRFAFARACNLLFASPVAAGVHPRATVDETAQVSETASVGAGCVIGARCVIGEGCILHPNVVLYDGVRMGRNVVVHAGTVIGADGYGYERGDDGQFEKFPHVGGVVIEDDVEIGSNTCIDRGGMSDTLIKQGAKIDNLVHVAHNVVVGAHTAVIAHSMLGGSVIIGDYSWVAPSACIMNQKTIGERATVGLQALVVKDVPEGATVMGSPAVAHVEFVRERRVIRSLVEAHQKGQGDA